MGVKITYSYEHPLAYSHLSLEKDFTSLCERFGYRVTDLSYHHNYDTKVIYALRKNPSPVSLSIRLSPDMMVSKDGETMFVELKTGRSDDIIRLEAYQLLCNQIREKYFHTPCLYVYRGRYTNGDIISCHAKDIIPKTLVIPDVQKNEQIRPILEGHFECEKMVKKIGSQFSGDAYIEIDDTKNWEPIQNVIK